MVAKPRREEPPRKADKPHPKVDPEQSPARQPGRFGKPKPGGERPWEGEPPRKGHR